MQGGQSGEEPAAAAAGGGDGRRNCRCTAAARGRTPAAPLESDGPVWATSGESCQAAALQDRFWWSCGVRSNATPVFHEFLFLSEGSVPVRTWRQGSGSP